jgi:very-short-patch-repair endonuclease
VDFVSFKEKLIIEIDGSPHKELETRINDKYRTQWLHSEGFEVLRFWNSEILDNLEGVVKKIKKYLSH